MPSPSGTSDVALLPADSSAPVTAQDVVESFLARLAASDVRGALELCDPAIEYVNVGLPTLHGHRGVLRVLGGLRRPSLGFEVYLHAIAAEGGTVLTERTDVLLLGPVRLQFWVAGRFDVRDGRITLWRDCFDYLDVARSTLRGLLGAAVPALRPGAPRSAAVPPGRH